MNNIEQLKALRRGKVHGGYRWAMIAYDGELICERCVCDEYRQIFRATIAKRPTSEQKQWRCVGVTYSGESEHAEHCVNCNALIWEHD